MVKIALDVMGYENELDHAIKATNLFLAKYKDCVIYLVGKRDLIEKNKLFKSSEHIVVVNANDVIEQNDTIISFRKKVDSSMKRAIDLVKNDECDFVLSAGNSGIYALLTYMNLKLIDNINSLAYMPCIPTKDKSFFYLLDVGAKIGCDENNLIQFGLMANAVAKIFKANPKINLLNIGQESHKGYDYIKKAHEKFLNIKDINYQGYVEPKKLMEHISDIVVCDGFIGNICLKTLEGTASSISSILKSYYKKPWNFMATLFSISLIKKIKKTFDYKKHAGAMVIGLNKLAIKTHGSADWKQFLSSLIYGYELHKNDVISKIKNDLKKIENN